MSFVIIYRKRLADKMVYRVFFLGRNFVSGLICTLKSKKKPKNFFSKKTIRFPALIIGEQTLCKLISTITFT